MENPKEGLILSEGTLLRRLGEVYRREYCVAAPHPLLILMATIGLSGNKCKYTCMYYLLDGE